MINLSDKRALIVVSILLISCLLGGLICLGILRASNELARIEVENAARRVGATPTLDGIGEYIVKSVKTGMSRDQVEKILGMIGPLDIQRGALEDLGLEGGPTACDEITLKLSRLPGNEWPMAACYDSKGGLVSLQSSDPDSFPSLNIYSP